METELSHVISRSSCPVVFCKKGALRNFAKFTEKHQRRSLFYLKRDPGTVVSMNFAKFLRTPFLTEHLRFLHLYKIKICQVLIYMR